MIAETEVPETVVLNGSSTDPRLTDTSDTGSGAITDDQGTNPIDEDITATIAVGDATTVTEANGNYLVYTVGLSNAVSEAVSATIVDALTGQQPVAVTTVQPWSMKSAPGVHGQPSQER